MSSFIKDWTQKEVDLLTASFKRYRIFVFIMKFILPISAGAILIAVIFFAQKEDAAAKLTVENISGKTIPTKDITSIGVMENPRFQGVDADDQPYSLKAVEAWQENADQIQMREITADITTKDGKWISAIAGAGLYFMKEAKANLENGVEVFITNPDKSIVHIQTTEAKVDMHNSLIYSESPITVKSDMADFSAVGFIADSDKEKITFAGPIKLVLIP